MKLWEYIELTLRLCTDIFSTFGRKSKPEVSLPHMILVLFRHEIIPVDRESDLESNELCYYIGKTGNTGKNRILVKITKTGYWYYFGTKFYQMIEKTIKNRMSYVIMLVKPENR